MRQLNYKIAEFKFSNPSGTKTPRAVLILVPPSNADGRDMIEEPEWKAYAEANDLILCGCFFQDKHPSGIEEYCSMDSDSGYALMDAWDTYALRNDFDYQTQFLMWGFSAGGQFNFEFTAFYPERVMAFVVNKGGIYYSALLSEEARKVPGLFLIGTKDSDWRQNIVMGLYSVNKACGAKDWTFATEPYGHSEGNSVKLGQDFFTRILDTLK